MLKPSNRSSDFVCFVVILFVVIIVVCTIVNLNWFANIVFALNLRHGSRLCSNNSTPSLSRVILEYYIYNR